MSHKPYATAPVATSGIPRGIPYIIGNEAAERFSFYGMRTILVVFMTKYLHFMVDGEVGPQMSDPEANEYYHNFVAATYFFPILGSLLSDILIGKYRTILSLSIVYCLGHLALALMGGAGLPPASWLVLGLTLIAIGSGGIKPCVSAHVGDQFGKQNAHLMTRVYQWFYFSINFGSTASTALTPIFLEWYGPHVAFGVPGVLMAIATVLFWMGRHKFIHVPAGGMKFFRETFSPEGVSALLKLSIIFAFIAIFWSVFDQTGSSWVLQADDMDLRFLGITWLQSQIQVVNPILVMALIPLFQFWLYPAVDKVFPLTSIRKISIGFFLTASSFAVLMFAQELIDRGETPSIAWQLWAYLLLTSGEIMISITGLEFAYTQAPRTMKSVIMAIFLFSVSLGNIFTSAVNHYIQIPGIHKVAEQAESLTAGETDNVGSFLVQTTSWTPESETSSDEPATEDADQESPKPGKEVRIAGADKEFDTADDVLMRFNEYHEQVAIETPDDELLEAAAERIDESFFASTDDDETRRLPLNDEGNELINGLTDSLGQQLQYQQVTRNMYRIISPGADQQPETQYSVILQGTVSRAIESDGEPPAAYTWLEQRIIETKGEDGKAQVEKDRGNIPETEISHSITVGGQNTLEGASYFRFWTYTVLITAFLFIPVGYLYKEKTYIQDEQESGVEGDMAAAAKIE